MDWLRPGDVIRVIEAENGALGANGSTGIVTDKANDSGLRTGPHIEVDDRVWGIGPNAQIEVVSLVPGWRRVPYCYAKPILKVGMVARRNDEDQCHEYDEPQQEITGLDGEWFWIAGCMHSFTSDAKLEILIEGKEMEQTQKQKQGRMTFRLKRAVPELKKGAIAQEACDDGDQDYIILDHNFVKYTNEDGDKDYIRLPRESVEKESSFWERVYPATPAWLNPEEIDAQKAFMAAQKKKPAKKTKTSKK